MTAPLDFLFQDPRLTERQSRDFWERAVASLLSPSDPLSRAGSSILQRIPDDPIPIMEPFFGAGRTPALSLRDIASFLIPATTTDVLLTAIPPAKVGKGVAKGAGELGEKLTKEALEESSEKMVRGAAAETAEGIRAFHGSGARFTKFDPGMVGTGQGAQTFGHGLYFAENPKVAKTYHAMLSPARGGGPEGVAARVLEATGSKDEAIKELRLRASREGVDEAFKKTMDDAEKLIREDRVGGGFYEVRIKTKPEEFLDWDKPLRTDVVDRVMADARNLGIDIPDEASGEMLYRRISSFFTQHGLPGDAAASQFLQRRGIPGIRYLDEGSRAAGEGTHNIVIFPGAEDLIETLTINGETVPTEVVAMLLAIGAGVGASQLPTTTPTTTER